MLNHEDDGAGDDLSGLTTEVSSSWVIPCWVCRDRAYRSSSERSDGATGSCLRSQDSLYHSLPILPRSWCWVSQAFLYCLDQHFPYEIIGRKTRKMEKIRLTFVTRDNKTDVVVVGFLLHGTSRDWYEFLRSFP